MKIILKTIMIVPLVIIGLIVVLFTGISVYMSLVPQTGSPPAGEHRETISQSPHYRDGQFVNLVETKMDMSFKNILKTLWEFTTFTGLDPKGPLPVKSGNSGSGVDTMVYITWYGHSAFLVEMEGKRILLDPMFGPAASPFSFTGQRYPYQEPIDLESFTDIDAVIISHDHYDHLDYSSIMYLKDHTKHFYLPLGVGSHFKHWGIDEAQYSEIAWWDSTQLGALTFIAAPARHFSGRAFLDRNKTQWASWVIKGRDKRIYFSGDGGYADHFKTIGDRYGPFDFTMLECGQYHERWAAIHMMPEETFQANIDLRGKVMMPIHWGAFTLALHNWTDPAVRVTEAAREKGIPVATPYIGERFSVGGPVPQTKWWESVQ